VRARALALPRHAIGAALPPAAGKAKGAAKAREGKAKGEEKVKEKAEAITK
jgi:hypothetical protein